LDLSFHAGTLTGFSALGHGIGDGIEIQFHRVGVVRVCKLTTPIVGFSMPQMSLSGWLWTLGLIGGYACIYAVSYFIYKRDQKRGFKS
jgi:hypothetical protein